MMANNDILLHGRFFHFALYCNKQIIYGASQQNLQRSSTDGL